MRWRKVCAQSLLLSSLGDPRLRARARQPPAALCDSEGTSAIARLCFTLQPLTERLLCAEHGRCSGCNGPQPDCRLRGTRSQRGTVSRQRSIRTDKDAAVGSAGPTGFGLLMGLNTQSFAPEMPRREGRSCRNRTSRRLTPTFRCGHTRGMDASSRLPCRAARRDGGWAGSALAEGEEARSVPGGEGSCGPPPGQRLPVSGRRRPRRKEGKRVLTSGFPVCRLDKRERVSWLSLWPDIRAPTAPVLGSWTRRGRVCRQAAHLASEAFAKKSEA